LLVGCSVHRRRDLGDFFDEHGWGFCMSVVIGRDVAGSRGAFGWDGGLGTARRSDPAQQAVRILSTQRAFTSPKPPDVCQDFWTAAAEVIGR
jgi:CubicO group peptidase (beta-lactamase class C family)